MLSQLFLIRHGETEWSLSGRHTGRTDVSLTAQGEADARSVGVRLRGVTFSKVLVSPRQRALRTCELADLSPPAEVDPDLAEWDYGDFEGITSSEILKIHPGWNIFRDGCPNGESPADVSTRADRLIARVRRLEGNIAVFSHGHFGRVLGVRWIGSPVSLAAHLLLGTASQSVLGFEHDNAAEPAIALWNEASRGNR